MFNNKIIKILMLLTVVLCACTSPALGQIIYGQPIAGDMQIVYSHWKLEDDGGTTEISQFMIPVSGFVPLGENFEGRFYIANTNSKLDFSDDDYSLNGIGDLRVQFSHSFSDDRLLASVGVNLPTGKKELNFTEEWIVLQSLSYNYLNVPVRRLGEGLGLNLLLGAATMMETVRLGGSVEFQYNGEYKPYETGEDYKPGNQFSIGVGADTKIGQVAYNAGVTFTLYSDDKLDNSKTFRQSNQLDFRFGGAYDNERYGLSSSVRYLVRGRNERYNTDGSALEKLKAYGNEFMINGRFTYHPQKEWFVAPVIDLRLVAANEYELDNASVIGFGSDFGRNLGETVNLSVGLKYYTGSADGGDIDLSGYQLSAGLTALF